ncbi:TonB-dependent receptor domain-containing protein [Sphingobium aromaticivastans]|uniref:TonB-dependent receptor domain-containing protein n=1 Tax=Sphingobium aromaticivastans TaxID=1778665 RepID=UPI00301814E9
MGVSYKAILAASISLTACLSHTSLFAQTAPVAAKQVASSAEDVAEGDKGADIVVTGTNISGIKPVGSAIVTVGQEQFKQTGLSNITDIARTLPQVQTVGFYREGNNTAVNSTQGSAINLRGLSPYATLTLLNGRRLLANGTNTTYTEANQVPLVALERVEVIADGASAVYGSDAIAGVVNYVLRKKFDGIQVGGNLATNRLNDEYTGSIIAGQSWDFGGRTGNIVLAYEYNHRNPSNQGDSPYLRQNLSGFGGRDSRISTSLTGAAGVGFAPNIAVPTGARRPPAYSSGTTLTLYGLPTGTSGTGLTVANLALNQPNLMDTSDYTDYTGRLDRHLASLSFNQELTDWATLYIDAFYSHRVTVSRSSTAIYATMPYRLTNGSLNPNYISAIPGIAAGASYTVFRNLLNDKGQSYFRNTSRSYTGTIGLDLKLFDSWKGNVYFTAGDERNCGLCTYNGSNQVAFQAQVNAGLINPQSTTPLTAAQLATFNTTRIQRGRNELRDFVVKANGPLFDLPAGAVKAAIGYEHTWSAISLTNSQNLTSNSTAFPAALYPVASNPYVTNVPYSKSTRKIDSAFAELFVPIIAEDQDVPLVQSLNLTGAIRYDRYSDFGSTVNPKFAASWELDDQLTVRGSWGTSYRAPGLAEKSPRITQLVSSSPPQQAGVNNSGDPAIPIDFPATGVSNLLLLQGANPNLGAEHATVWSAGADFKPRAVPNLNLSLTYYNIKYKDQLIYFTAGDYLASPTARQLYAKYITVTPIPANCNPNDPATYNPLVRQALEGINLTGTVTPGFGCLARAILDVRGQNASASRQEGLDFTGSYSVDTKAGNFTLNGSVTHVLLSKQTPVPGGAEISALDRINTVTTNFPVSWKGRASLDWSLGAASAGATVNYIGSYTNDRPLVVNGVTLPVSKVPSWTTFDIRVGINYGEDVDGWIRGLGFNITFVNVTNKNPPLVLSSVGAGGFDLGAFDGNNANPFGRRINLQLTKRF